MINWDMINFTEFDEVILSEEPYILCSREQLECRVENKDEQVGFWKTLLEEWEQKGIIVFE